MYDSEKIIAGLIIGIGLLTFPMWYNVRKLSPPPEPKIVTKEKRCIEPKQHMVTYHMKLLDLWRDSVVREGKRIYKSTGGKEYRMSLTNTCLECHPNKAAFCDRCHDYLIVKPYCWDCHIVPEEIKR